MSRYDHYDMAHEPFFFPLRERRDGGALAPTGRSSRVSNQLSTLPIRIFTTYYRKQKVERSIEHTDRGLTHITEAEGKILSLGTLNFFTFSSIIICNIQIRNFLVPIIQIAKRERNTRSRFLLVAMATV